MGQRSKNHQWMCLLVLVAAIIVPLLPARPVAAVGPYTILVSTSANRANAVPLDGRTVSGPIYVFTLPQTSDITRVRFFLDDPQMSSAPRTTERFKPYDFADGETNAANPFDTTTVGDGTHTITAAVDLSSGVTEVVTATFTTDNGVAPIVEPDQVHLAWVDDPATTMTIVWHTSNASLASNAQHRQKGAATWIGQTGAKRPSGTSGTLHEVTLTGLSPATGYEYRLWGPSGWSTVFETRTAPPAGAASFDAIYVADTGLIGREDGLASGTEQVIDEIAAMNPLVVLPGGDYAYYDTDKRFGNKQNTIDAWFNQMQPIATRSPMMPTYGNHEAGEGYDFWAARFPTPEGFDNRRNFSFDIGDTHFVSIYAVQHQGELPAATVAWIEQDILAAQAAGQRWIIPYFHVSPFSSGDNHPSNIALQNQIGPLFEELGVKVVLASHDQSYERAWPLEDIGGGNMPTSSALDCYTMDDGVTFVKISPGGKLSNINGNFADWSTPNPPSWTAVRDNTMHHFARVRVFAEGQLTVEAWGVTGDGSPPVLQDSFTYSTSGCGQSLSLTPSSLAFTTTVGGSPPSQSLTVQASPNANVAFSTNDDAPWLAVAPASGTTPQTLTVSANAAGLSPGTYSATISVNATGYSAQTTSVTLTVQPGGDYGLYYSAGADRAGPSVLDGATISGPLYAFTAPDTTGISRVRFYLDDPQMSGAAFRSERNAPYDFNGGMVAVATAFDTTTLLDGTHTITAAIEKTDSTTVVLHASFTVENDEEPPTPTGIPLPGTFQVEDYRDGGAGVGYHDLSAGNTGGKYRIDDVDIQVCSDPTTPSGETCHNVGWVEKGEWLAYDVSVASAGSYMFTFRVATPSNGRRLRVELNGVNLTGAVPLPNTGGWQTWASVTTGPVTIAAGNHTLRIVMENGGFNLNSVTVAASP